MAARFAMPLFPFVATTLTAHRNPVTCILAGLDGPLVVRAGGERIEGDLVLIRPGVEHEVDIGGRARVLYFDGLPYPLEAQLAARVPRALTSTAIDTLGGRLDAQLELRARFSANEERSPLALAHVLDEIARDPMQRMSQSALMQRLGRSRTHALRMFKAFTGMTFRGFKQWSALCAAARQLAAGQLVRTAAMDAGFSDTAHLTRTFRESFGTTPTLATADLRAARGES